MEDDVLYTWVVKNSLDITIFTCRKKETAEYLRDWCNAESENKVRAALEMVRLGYIRYPKRLATLDNLMKHLYDEHRIDEGEVIL